MALSNWDTIMIDQNGDPLPGIFVFPSSKIEVEIYKNHLHIHDKKAYIKSEAAYTEPIVMTVDNGSIDYKDIHIVAFRGPQNGVFAIGWHDIYDKEYENHIVEGFIGAGVYGFAGHRYVGVTKSSLKWFHNLINRERIDIDTLCSTEYIGKKRISTRQKVAIKYQEFMIPDVFKSMPLIKGERYNQGDAFFTSHISTPLQNTKPGKAKKTTFSKVLGKL